MENNKRNILKGLLSGRIAGPHAVAQLKNGGKTIVSVWVQGLDKLWRKWGSEEGITREELLEKRKRQDPFGFTKVITIGGKRDEQ